jgi:protein-tyrosine phosphatase
VRFEPLQSATGDPAQLQQWYDFPADKFALERPMNGLTADNECEGANADVVLFLCTGNYYRSRFAEILFNHLAREREMPWRAESRGLDLKIGTRNVGPLSVHARDACAARGLPLPEPLRMPAAAREGDFASARLVVALKEAEHRPYLARLFPDWHDRVRYWHVHDLDASSADIAMAELEALVRALVNELAPPTRSDTEKRAAP